MATYLEAVNEVQRRLRKPITVAVDTNTYSTLLGDFINQAKREVEDTWNWSMLRSIQTVTTASGTKSYAITGAGKRSRILGDVMNDTTDNIIHPVPDHVIDKQVYLTTITNDEPVYYMIRGVDSSGDMKIEFFDTPDAIYSIKMLMVVPQADLVAGTDEAVEITVPQEPVILRAWSLAISERGEDGGNMSNKVDGMALRALDDLVALDGGRKESELVWTPV